jgi:hypothetical protein
VNLSVEVLIAETISAAEATQLVEDFETIGLTADVREVSPRRSMGDIAWFVLPPCRCRIPSPECRSCWNRTCPPRATSNFSVVTSPPSNGGSLHYDLHRGRWRSELDEVDKAASHLPTVPDQQLHQPCW